MKVFYTVLVLQTVTHQHYFRAPDPADGEEGGGTLSDHHGIEVRSIPFHALLLVGSMIPIVMLSKNMAKLVDYGIAVAGAPVALGGFLVAVLVLTPEAIAAVRAAMDNQLQRSVNICLGSALSTIGLTVVAILGIGLFTGRQVVLGLAPAESVLLALTIVVSLVTFNRYTNFIQGVIHIVLFATYLLLIFD